MTETRIPLSVLDLIAATRAALGAGLGLLVADRLSKSQRRAAGWTLLLIGVLSTGPLLFEVLNNRRLSDSKEKRKRKADGEASEGDGSFRKAQSQPAAATTP